MVYDEPKAPALRRLSFLRIGMRTIKTVIAAMLAALFMKHVMHQTMFFACIGAITAVEKTVSSSVRASVIRNIGTITGGLVSIAISSSTENIALISLGLIPMIWLITPSIKKNQSYRAPLSILRWPISTPWIRPGSTGSIVSWAH